MGASNFLSYLALALSLTASANAFFLMSLGTAITKQRIDPIVNPGKPSGHAHIVFGGSNFATTVSTAKLGESACTSTPIVEDNSLYWAPLLYFQYANGNFSSVDGGAVVYYLFPDQPGATTPFPPDFRMLSGSPTKRSYDPSSFAQQAVTFLCLDFNGVTTKHDSLPNKVCPSGIRSQINFPSCWDGKNLDSPDHKSHVAFRSGGPDSGDCKDPKYPVSIPRLFLEIYWGSQDFDKYRSQAKNPDQPFLFSYGDPTGYGNHADFYNGWKDGVLKKVVDGCTCGQFGDMKCCGQGGKNLFTIQDNKQCRITPTFDEQITGTLSKLPGNNPVVPAGSDAVMLTDPVVPGIIEPVYAYTGNSPTATGKVVIPASTIGGGAPATVTPTPVSSLTIRPPASSPLPTGTGAISTPAVVPAPPVTNSDPAGSKPTDASVPPPSPTGTTTDSVPVDPKPTVTAVPASSVTNTNTDSVPTGSKPTFIPVPVPSVTNTIIASSSSAPNATVSPSGTTPAVTGSSSVHIPPSATQVPSKPLTTKICKKKSKFHSSHRHGCNQSGKNIHKRYDFDVDDYYQQMA